MNLNSMLVDRNIQECIPLNTYGDFCKIIGLNWVMAEELFDRGFLNQRPVVDQFPNDEAQKELIFIGTMISAGISLDILRFVTSSLKRPYAYKHSDIYFDWSRNIWLEKTQEEEPWEIIQAYIEQLVEDNNIDSLIEFKYLIDEAIKKGK